MKKYALLALLLYTAVSAFAQDMEVFPQLGHSGKVTSVAFSPDGRQVLSGSEDETIKLWDTNTGSEIRTFSGHTNRVSSVAFSHDGRQILSGSAEKPSNFGKQTQAEKSRLFPGILVMLRQ